MSTDHHILNVLFLCTHNSARSILAEAMLNHLGKGRFKAYSAGSMPRDHEQPHPIALETLAHAGISTAGLRSKSWDEFAGPNAPHMDLVITVCDNAAKEACPYWPGHPATAHWGYEDPSAVEGGEDRVREAFKHTLHLMGLRLELMINLPPNHLERMALADTAQQLAKGQ